MEIRNIALLLDLDRIDLDLVALASDIATRNNALLIGVAAAEPPMVAMGMEGATVATSIYADQLAAIEGSLAEAEKAFSSAVPSGVNHRWVSGTQRPDMAILSVGLAADLIVVGSDTDTAAGGNTIDTGSILLGAGRPVLVAASGMRRLDANKIVVAWKDTKEARRAIVDALPFLKAAEEVLVVVVDEGNLASERDSMLDTVAWLKSHDVVARGDVLPNREGLGNALLEAASELGAGLIVSGAYGHSKLRQWLFGGMTSELIGEFKVSRLMSN